VNEKRVFEFSEGLLKRGIKLFWAATAEAKIRYFFPFPGTPMHDRAVEDGYVGPETFEEWGNVKFDTPLFSIN